MDGLHPRADLAPRDVVARAIEATMRRDGSDHVWLDATGVSPDILRRRFPTVLASCARIGVDLLSEQIPVAPAEHFLCGGVRTDRDGATDVPGLYAVGEVAATRRTRGQPARVQQSAGGIGLRAARRHGPTLELPAADRGGSHEVALGEDREPERIRTILSRYAGIRRDGAGLNAAADELETAGTGPLATVARSVIVAATARQGQPRLPLALRPSPLRQPLGRPHRRTSRRGRPTDAPATSALGRVRAAGRQVGGIRTLRPASAEMGAWFAVAAE